MLRCISSRRDCEADRGEILCTLHSVAGYLALQFWFRTDRVEMADTAGRPSRVIGPSDAPDCGFLFRISDDQRKLAVHRSSVRYQCFFSAHQWLNGLVLTTDVN